MRPSANTLDGKPPLSSLIFAFTLVMTSIGLAPYLATTTPPTTSAPSLSKIPLRAAGPNVTLPISLILMEVKSAEVTTAFSISSTDFT